MTSIHDRETEALQAIEEDERLTREDRKLQEEMLTDLETRETRFAEKERRLSREEGRLLEKERLLSQRLQELSAREDHFAKEEQALAAFRTECEQKGKYLKQLGAEAQKNITSVITNASEMLTSTPKILQTLHQEAATQSSDQRNARVNSASPVVSDDAFGLASPAVVSSRRANGAIVWLDAEPKNNCPLSTQALVSTAPPRRARRASSRPEAEATSSSHTLTQSTPAVGSSKRPNALHTSPDERASKRCRQEQTQMDSDEGIDPGNEAESSSPPSADDVAAKLTSSSIETKSVWARIRFPAGWEDAHSLLLLERFAAADKKGADLTPEACLDYTCRRKIPSCLYSRMLKRAGRWIKGADGTTNYNIPCVNCERKMRGPCVDVCEAEENTGKTWRLVIRQRA